MRVFVVRDPNGKITAILALDATVTAAKTARVHGVEVLAEIPVDDVPTQQTVDLIKAMCAISDDFTFGLEDMLSKVVWGILTDLKVIAKAHGIGAEQLSNMIMAEH